MGAVDLVIQVEAPPSAHPGCSGSGGRGGHQVGEISRAALFPKHRGDVMHTAVVDRADARGPHRGRSACPRTRSTSSPSRPSRRVRARPARRGGVVRHRAPQCAIPRSPSLGYEATLDLLAGRYPSDEFAELRPRLVWGPRSRHPHRPPRRAATRGHERRHDPGSRAVRRVHRGRDARRRARSASSTRRWSTSPASATSSRSARRAGGSSRSPRPRQNVLPAFGQPGRVPFWHGDGIGRPRNWAKHRETLPRGGCRPRDRAVARLTAAGLDSRAIDNLLAYLADQRAATGSIPTDRSLTVERSRDEVGDWRIILHSPYGMQVHSPWALAGQRTDPRASGRRRLGRRERRRHHRPRPGRLRRTAGADLFVFDADELERLVVDEVGGSALFASRFRECAARALLMPRTNPTRRSPLWQQRQRSAQLLEVAHKHPTVPDPLETLREVCRTSTTCPLSSGSRAGSRSAASASSRRRRSSPPPSHATCCSDMSARSCTRETPPSPSVGPAACSVDPALLGELLGTVELRELLDPEVIAQTERELQRLDPERHARGVEGGRRLLRVLGPLDAAEVAARLRPMTRGPRRHCSPSSSTHVARSPCRSAGSRERPRSRMPRGWRDALGSALPVGIPHRLPRAGSRSARRPRRPLCPEPTAPSSRTTSPRASASGSPSPAPLSSDSKGRGGSRAGSSSRPRPPTAGARASGATRKCCAGCECARSRPFAGQRRAGRARCVRALLPAWQHLTAPRGPRRRRARDRAAGGSASSRERVGVTHPPLARERLHARDARRADRERRGRLVGPRHPPGRDGWIALHPAEAAPVTLADTEEIAAEGLETRLLAALSSGGAFFSSQLRGLVDAENEQSVTEGLWNLAWAGRVTNDTFAPVRALLGAGAQAHRTARRAPAPVCTVGRGPVGSSEQREGADAGRSCPSGKRMPRCGPRRPPRSCSNATAS